MTDEVTSRRRRLDNLETRMTALEKRLEATLEAQEQINDQVMRLLRTITAKIEHPSNYSRD